MNIFSDPGGYHTNKDHPRLLMDRLFMNTRFFFFFKYAGLVIRSCKLAKKGVYDRQAWVNSSYDIFKLIENCGGRFHITGLQHVQECGEPVVFVSNHMSALETMIFPCLIATHKEVTFVVKESLLHYPFFGPVLQARNPIAVSRENSREDLLKVLNEGRELLAQGTSVIIFPQSTRKPVLIPEEFNSLAVKLAAKAQVKLISIAIKTDFWGNSRLIKDIGHIDRSKPIYMEFGEPMSVTGTGKTENEAVIDFISSRLDKWSKSDQKNDR